MLRVASQSDAAQIGVKQAFKHHRSPTLEHVALYRMINELTRFIQFPHGMLSPTQTYLVRMGACYNCIFAPRIAISCLRGNRRVLRVRSIEWNFTISKQ